jgi:hypothetical protein
LSTSSGRNPIRHLRDKLTYSNVVSTLCLLLLLGGGTAYAATHLPKNSVGARQIRKGAITPAKLSRGARAALTGAQGPLGPKGEKGDRGEKGDQGARGPSNAITKFTPGSVAWSTTYTTVESVDLGAGSWVVTGTGLFDNFESSGEGAECRLLVGGANVAESGELRLAPFAQTGSHLAFSVTGGATVAAGAEAELQCKATVAAGFTLKRAITAIQVSELKTE